MEFRDIYLMYKNDIGLTALNQRLPGLDYDDVVSEMNVCLWLAHETWDAEQGISLGAYWWSLWMNRKRNLLRDARALKRPVTVLVSEQVERHYVDRLHPEAPDWCDGVDLLIWKLLASGEPVGSTLTLTNTSKRSYYSLIQRLKNAAVRTSLRD